MTKRFFFLLPLLAALPFGVSSQADTVPGFGNVSFAKGAWWYSDFGLIAFADEGRDVSRAFSSSLGTELATDGTGVYSRDYGKITPSGEPGWVMTEGFGWVHFATGEQDYGPWVWTQRIGWIRHASSDMGTIFWIPQIQSWGQVQEDGSFYSFDYRRLTPTDDPAIFVSEIFGPVRIGEQKGWLSSETFGMIWASRESEAKSFYSSARDEWIDVLPDNSIWSHVEGRFLDRPSTGDAGAPADFDINNVIWSHTDVSTWPVTSELTSVEFRGSQICLDFDKTNDWKTFIGGSSPFNATPIVIAKVNGRYHAGTYHWFRPSWYGPSQTCKPIETVWLNSRIPGWRPRSGETVGFMVSTPSRAGVPTRQTERTNIVWIQWP